MTEEKTVAYNASIKTNMVMNTVLTVSNFLFPLITYAYVTRVLMAVGIGQVAFVQSVLGYFGFIAALGIGGYARRECSKCRSDKDKLSKLVQELLFINIISTILAYVILIISVLCISKFNNYISLFCVMSWSIILSTIGVEWLYTGLEKFTYITVRSIVFKIISVVLIFLLIKSPDDVLIYGALSIFATSASNILNFYNARKYVKLKNYGNYNIKRHLQAIMFFFMSTVAISIYGHLDSVMLGFLKEDADVGFYNVALKIKSTALSFSTAITSVLVPRFSFYVGENDYDNYNKLLVKSAKVSLVLMLPLSVFVMIFAKDIVGLLCGDTFYPSVFTVKIAMLCVLALSVTNLLGNQVLIPNGKEKHFSKTVFLGLWINLIGNFFLIPVLGAAGAAISTLFTETFNALWFAKECNKELKYMYKKIKIAVYLVPLLISSCIGMIIYTCLPLQAPFFRLVIFSISFFLPYYLILLLQKEEIVVIGINTAIKGIKKLKHS